MSLSLADRIYRSDTKHDLDAIFNIESPYKYPPLIISRNPMRDNMNIGIYNNYMDSEPVNINGVNEVFNIRNQKMAAELQKGYSRNIDLDSELKHINYYEDKGYHNNRKMDPYNPSVNKNGNGLGLHASELVIDYSPVGYVHNKMCVDYYPPKYTNNNIQNNNIQNNNIQNNNVQHDNIQNNNIQHDNKCNNVGPDSRGFIGVDSDRYDFSFIKFQEQNCLSGMKNDLKRFERANEPNLEGSHYSKNKERDAKIMKSMEADPRYSKEMNKPIYYKFHNGLMNPNFNGNGYNPERLFNNITKRSMLPNFQNITDINPQYIR